MKDTEKVETEAVNRMLSRRNFLKGAAVLTAGTAMAGLVGCAKEEAKESWMPEKWDYEADLIAVGGGAAGHAAVIEAHDQGMTAILLESMDTVGGSSVLCNGGISMPGTPLQKEQGIEDSPEIMYNDLVKNTAPDNFPELIKVHCDNAAHLWDWLTGMGVQFKKESLIATAGMSRAREHHVRPADVMPIFIKVAKEKGAQTFTKARATELIQDPVTKRVLGVKAEQDGKTLYFKGKRAVALTCGDYSRNDEMLAQYNLGAEQAIKFSGMGNKGDGILMAQMLGADTRHMGYIGLLTGQHPSGEPTRACSMFNVGAVLVNKEGKRFVKESLGYAQVWSTVSAQTDSICYQVWDQNIATKFAANDSSLYDMRKIEKSGVMLKADTLEELAALMKIPADAFVATMNKYNSDIQSLGYDTSFDRRTIISDQGVPFALNNPPFYGFETTNVLYVTQGGLKENTGSQPLDVRNNPIPGLYCAGGIVGYAKYGINTSNRVLKSPSGIGYGGAMIYGRLVAQYIAKLDAWDAEKKA